MQIKKWNFDKNITKNDMALLVAKAEKRGREEGKETIFYCSGQRIRPERLIGFKKRKVSIDAPSPSAGMKLYVETETGADISSDAHEHHLRYPEAYYRSEQH